MSFFSVTDVVHNVTFGKYASLNTAVLGALTEAQKQGKTEFFVGFGPYACTIRDGVEAGAVLFTAQVIGTVSRSNEVTAQRSKRYTLLGRPSATGWYKAKNTSMAELNLTSALLLIKEKPKTAKTDTYVVYVDANGEPVSVVDLPNMRALISKELATQTRNAKIEVFVFVAAWVSKNLLCNAEGVPAEACGLFIIYNGAPLAKRYVNNNSEA